MEKMSEYVTAIIGSHLCGLPIERVQHVFVPDRLTPVPLAPFAIAGLLNLRGRIVTMIDMRHRLELESAQPECGRMAIGVECSGECYGLLIDGVGEVLKLPVAGLEGNPVNLDERLKRLSRGVHRLGKSVLVVLDVDQVLDTSAAAVAA
ncbi:MAG: chemotaxis protein CheW [Xanthobacteraceae bacterium]